jgi:hypothetical protein
MRLGTDQVIVTLFLVPDLVAWAIAEAKDRRALSLLLTTRLSGGAIALGKPPSCLP